MSNSRYLSFVKVSCFYEIMLRQAQHDILTSFCFFALLN